MNCKPGDLAILISAPENSIGTLLRVIQICPDEPLAWEFEDASRPIEFFEDEESRGFFTSTKQSGGLAIIDDADLRPLRDNPGTDETLTWAPVPNKETA